MTVELPFTLTHPKPPEEMMVSAVPRPSPVNHALHAEPGANNLVPVDPDLIHIDTRCMMMMRHSLHLLLAFSPRIFS